MYIHSNINVRAGFVQYIINGPEMHRWHHAVDDDAHDRNFGTKFAFWDWLFGTAFVPKNRKPVGYGLGDENSRRIISGSICLRSGSLGSEGRSFVEY